MDDLDAVVESAIDYVFTKRKYVFDFDHYLRSSQRSLDLKSNDS